MTKTQTPKDKASKNNSQKVEDTPNSQVPVRGRDASDKEFSTHYNESVKRNHRLMELLAR